jgi:hypothetical protein
MYVKCGKDEKFRLYHYSQPSYARRSEMQLKETVRKRQIAIHTTKSKQTIILS